MTKQKYRLLVYLISPTHLIAAVSAIKSVSFKRNFEVDIVVCWPGLSKETNFEITKTIRIMSRGFSNIKKIIPLAQSELDVILRQKSIGEAKKKFGRLMGEPRDYDQIYYSHSLVSQFYQFLSSAYPHSRRICFGDGLGFVFEKDVYFSYYESSGRFGRIMDILATRLVKLSTRKIPLGSNQTLALEDPLPHQAILILPVDQSSFLKYVPLKVVPKKIAKEVLRHCAASAKDLSTYVKALILKEKKFKKYLLLTENFTEGNSIDFSQEIEMWCDIIRKNCDLGSVVFLKPHPGETLPRNKEIKKKLGSDYRVVSVDRKFQRYPIEIWEELVCSCDVVSLSCSNLYLKYFYDINVIQPMSASFIKKWFKKRAQRQCLNSLVLYEEPLKNLGGWNHKSVLWSGDS